MSDDAKPMSLRDTIAPKSDQLNYEDGIAGPFTVRVVGMAKGSPEQPVRVRVVNDATGEAMRDFVPCKTVRRVLVAAWGDKGKDWIGKRATICADHGVKFGGATVGGLRVSHVSGITETLRLNLTTTRSKRAEFVVQPLADAKGGEQ